MNGAGSIPVIVATSAIAHDAKHSSHSAYPSPVESMVPTNTAALPSPL